MHFFAIQKPLEFSRYLAFLEQSRLHGRESILFCEHKPTITAGLQSRPQDLLQSPMELARKQISYYSVMRGGKQTAHEPGQRLCYVHLNLAKREKKLGHLFGALLEAAQEAILQVWGIETQNSREAPGLYTNEGKKLLSIGLDYRKNLTGFGIALNINNDLSTFSYIHPCGDPGLRITSIAQETKGSGTRPSAIEFSIRSSSKSSNEPSLEEIQKYQLALLRALDSNFGL